MKKINFYHFIFIILIIFSYCLYLPQKINANEISKVNDIAQPESLKKPQPVSKDLVESVKIITHFIYGFFIIITTMIMIYGIRTFNKARKYNNKKEKKWALTIIIGDIIMFSVVTLFYIGLMTNNPVILD